MFEDNTKKPGGKPAAGPGQTTTERLDHALKSTHPSELGRFFKENKDSMAPDDSRPFYRYFVARLKEKGIQQDTLFSSLGLTNYAGRIIRYEKHSKNRDLILGLCIGAHFSLPEINRALKLYEMPPLYARVKRDAIIISAISDNRYELDRINQLLEKNHVGTLVLKET